MMKIDFRKVKIRVLLNKDEKKFLDIIERHEGHRYPETELNELNGEEESEVLGAFYKKKLIGYLEYGNIMDGTDEILLYPGWEYDDPYIETLYVDKEYRGNYVGLLLIHQVIGYTNRPVFLIADNKDLVAYYEKSGFRHLGDLGMVFEPESEE